MSISAGKAYDGCLACKALWEPLPADAPPDVDGSPQPFRKACDNCAFRRGSPERSDEDGWEGMLIGMAGRESAFYCHKGVPLSQPGDGYVAANGENPGFRYPLMADGKSHDLSRLRVCAGFIAWWKGLTRGRGPIPGLSPAP
ncbi:hypothetical protein [Sphingomonas sp. KC8]|uniref:hypothetical protein n=1 Tax=Sphingomonas sp. KC8 TaxID=1030157 RepID=UPI000248A068|nr:hypothetical protein [Sphingomonas sp. KC8]